LTTLTSLHRRHFEHHKADANPENLAALRASLHAFAAGAVVLECTQFNTELQLLPGVCDSLSFNRIDCGNRSYDPRSPRLQRRGEHHSIHVYVQFVLPFTAVHVSVCQLPVGRHANSHDPEPQNVSFVSSFVAFMG